MAITIDPVSTFIQSTYVPLDQAHAPETLDAAEEVLSQYAEFTDAKNFRTSILGDPIQAAQWRDVNDHVSMTGNR